MYSTQWYMFIKITKWPKKLEEKHLAVKKKGQNNENCQLTNNSHSCTVFCIQLQRIWLHLTILGRWNLRYKACLLKRPANIFKTQILTFSQHISVHKPSVCVFFLVLFIVVPTFLLIFHQWYIMASTQTLKKKIQMS